MLRNSGLAEKLERAAQHKAHGNQREGEARQQQGPRQPPQFSSDAEAAEELEKAIAHLQKHRSDHFLSNDEAREIRKLKPGSSETAQQEVLALIFQRLRDIATAPTTSTHKRHVIERAEAVIKRYRQKQSRERVERQRTQAPLPEDPAQQQPSGFRPAEQRPYQARAAQRQARKTLDEEERTSRSDSHEQRPSQAQVIEQQRRHDISAELLLRQAGAAERRRRNYQGQSTSPGSRKSVDIDIKKIANFLSSAPDEMQNQYVEAVRRANQLETQLERNPNAAEELDALAPTLFTPVFYSQQGGPADGNPQHRGGQTQQSQTPAPRTLPRTQAPRSQPQTPPSRFHPQPQAPRSQPQTSAPRSQLQPQAPRSRSQQQTSTSQTPKSQTCQLQSQLTRVARSSRDLSELLAAAAISVESQGQRQAPAQGASQRRTHRSPRAVHPQPQEGQAESRNAPGSVRSGQAQQGPQSRPLLPSAIKKLTIVLASLKEIGIISLVEAEVIRDPQKIEKESVKDLIEDVIRRAEAGAREAEFQGIDPSPIRDMMTFLELHLATRYETES